MKKLNKQGFTLVELLAVIVLLAIIMGIVNISYAYINNQSGKGYYQALEESIKMATADYYFYNRNTLSLNDNKIKIPLSTLVNENFIDDIKDTNHNSCTNTDSYALVIKKSADQYIYTVCLINCGNYTTESEYCD